MSSLQAMEWLIQHQGDSNNIDEQFPPTLTNNTQDISLSQVEATLSLPADISKVTTEDLPNPNIDTPSIEIFKREKMGICSRPSSKCLMYIITLLY